MFFSRSTIRVAVLLFPLFCAEPVFAQEKPRHPCFEQPNDSSKDAIHLLPESARYWLTEDAIYIMTPEERCAFLHLNTDKERDQFIEQFWYRRTVDPIPLRLRLCEACTHDGQVAPSVAYPLFIRVSKPSGQVVDTSELTADMTKHDRSDSGVTLTAHFDVPLVPGTYQLAIAAKNATTGEVGVLRTQLVLRGVCRT